MFQSLFFWNHHLDLLSRLDSLREAIGVSILVFLEPPLRQSEAHENGNRKTMFQSLFFWKPPLRLKTPEVEVAFV